MSALGAVAGRLAVGGVVAGDGRSPDAVGVADLCVAILGVLAAGPLKPSKEPVDAAASDGGALRHGRMTSGPWVYWPTRRDRDRREPWGQAFGHRGQRESAVLLTDGMSAKCYLMAPLVMPEMIFRCMTMKTIRRGRVMRMI